MQKKTSTNIIASLFIVAISLFTVLIVTDNVSAHGFSNISHVKHVSEEGGSDCTSHSGGGKAPDACKTVDYGDWGTCVNGSQFRDIIKLNGQTIDPAGVSICRLTVEQQTARVRSCDQDSKKEAKKQVLGVTKYANGTLLRSPDHRIFAIIDGKKKYVPNLTVLARDYFGVEILDVDFEVVNAIPNL